MCTVVYDMLCYTNILLESTKKREEETENCSCKHGGALLGLCWAGGGLFTASHDIMSPE